eukprot:11919765-Heterocapsa_arctica.AAC.1
MPMCGSGCGWVFILSGVYVDRGGILRGRERVECSVRRVEVCVVRESVFLSSVVMRVGAGDLVGILVD